MTKITKTMTYRSLPFSLCSRIHAADPSAAVKCVKAKKRVKRKLDHGGGSFV